MLAGVDLQGGCILDGGGHVAQIINKYMML